MRNFYKILGLLILMGLSAGCSKDGNILLLPPSGLVNGGFEYGDHTGWDHAGDTRIIRALDTLPPFHGRYMALLTTSMDPDRNFGNLSQTFMVKEGHNYLTFSWNLIFENFPAQLTHQPQDYFRVTIASENKQEQMLLLLNASITAFQFGATEQSTGDLQPVSTEIYSNAFMTGWQQTTIAITSYQGEEVTILFEAVGREQSEFGIGVMVDEVDLN